VVAALVPIAGHESHKTHQCRRNRHPHGVSLRVASSGRQEDPEELRRSFVPRRHATQSVGADAAAAAARSRAGSSAPRPALATDRATDRVAVAVDKLVAARGADAVGVCARLSLRTAALPPTTIGTS
jgi:hypothetical protein